MTKRSIQNRLEELEGVDEEMSVEDVDLSAEAAEAVRYVHRYRRENDTDLTPGTVDEALDGMDDEVQEAYRTEVHERTP